LPSSDFSDGSNLDIDLNWQPVHIDDAEDFQGIFIKGANALASSYRDLLTPDDNNTDFSKPVQFDGS